MGMIIDPYRFGLPDASISYRTTETQDSAATTYTFTSKDIGTAATGRRIIVGVIGSGAASRTISSVTVGGNAATAINFVEGSVTGAFLQSAIYIIQVDAGTTATVVVTFSAGSNRCGIGVWAAYGLQSSSATATGTSVANPQTASLNISAGGVALGAAQTFDNQTLTGYAWTNLTENFDGLAGTNQVALSGASAAFAAAQTSLALTATPQGMTSFDAGAAAFASFR